MKSALGSSSAGRALVATLVLPGSPTAQATNPFAEILRLAETAGAQVVGTLMQKRPNPHPKTGFGPGKCEEMAQQAAACNADLVLVDFDLSPSQGRNLEKLLDLRVVDRTELILDIFAAGARSKQAKLQVEMAQSEYLKTRLTRMWTHLERTEGAIGARGPGETQLETDRRLVSKRISILRRRLQEISERRKRELGSREDAIRISLVGYTNAGKSSLLRLATGEVAGAADRLFATLDTRVRRWRLQDGREVILGDTVGFIRDLPHHLVASFYATLEETKQADLLLRVCDAADPDLELQMEAVDVVLQQIGAHELPSLVVMNQIDRVTVEKREALQSAWPDAVLMSARTGEGFDQLQNAISLLLDEWSLHLDLSLPASAGQLLAALRTNVRVEREDWVGEEWQARVSLLPRHWQPLQEQIRAVGARWTLREID